MPPRRRRAIANPANNTMPNFSTNGYAPSRARKRPQNNCSNEQAIALLQADWTERQNLNIQLWNAQNPDQALQMLELPIADATQNLPNPQLQDQSEETPNNNHPILEEPRPLQLEELVVNLQNQTATNLTPETNNSIAAPSAPAAQDASQNLSSQSVPQPPNDTIISQARSC